MLRPLLPALLLLAAGIVMVSSDGLPFSAFHFCSLITEKRTASSVNPLAPRAARGEPLGSVGFADIFSQTEKA